MKYDQKKLDKMADDLEEYLDILDRFIIIEGISEDEYRKAVKTVKKLISKLRKGKGDDVFNKEVYREMIEKGDDFA